MNRDNLRRVGRGFFGFGIIASLKKAEAAPEFKTEFIAMLDTLIARTRQMGLMHFRPTAFMHPTIFLMFRHAFPVRFTGVRWVAKIEERTIPIWITLETDITSIYVADPRFLLDAKNFDQSRLAQWGTSFYIWLLLRTRD